MLTPASVVQDWNKEIKGGTPVKARMTVREYAAQEQVTLGTVYRRIWEGQVNAEQIYGRWLISPNEKPKPMVPKDATESAMRATPGR